MKKKEPVSGRIDVLTRRVAERAGQSEARTRKFIDALFEEVGEGLTGEERVSLAGFGIFKKKFAEKRTGYNPQKKKKIKIKAHNRVVFTPAGALANAVNRKYRHLRPNVIDEMKVMTGLMKREKTTLSPARKKARFRAIVTLGVLAFLFLLLLSLIISIPAIFRESDAQVVRFVRDLNTMMGLRDLTKSLSDNLPERMNEKELGHYIFRTRGVLTRNRKIIEKHGVRRGESIYSIAKKYYGNKFLWPDLYYQNKNRFEDPDLIHVGDKIYVHEKLGDPGNFTPQQKRQLVQAYITMYRVLRALGKKEIASGNHRLIRKGKKRLRDSRWTLHTALRYDHKLLNVYEDAIYPEDRKIVDTYIDRLGYGDGTRRHFWDYLF